MKSNSVRFPFIVCLVFYFIIILFQYRLTQITKPLYQVNPTCAWCPSQTVDEVALLPVNSRISRNILPADPGFFASLVWIRTKYYFGAQSIGPQSFENLLLLLDQITDLSPQWYFPYFFGGIVLYAEAGQPDEAFFIVNKGIRYHPESWQLHFLKGFMEWQYYRIIDQASLTLFAASRLPGAPAYLPKLAATLADQAGNREQALEMLYDTMEGILDPGQRKELELKIEELSLR